MLSRRWLVGLRYLYEEYIHLLEYTIKPNGQVYSAKQISTTGSLRETTEEMHTKRQTEEKKKKKRFYKTVLGSDIRKVGEKNGDKDDKEELGESRG